MCGISIIYRIERAPIDGAPARIAAMNRAVAHRGPDADGVLIGPGLAFWAHTSKYCRYRWRRTADANGRRPLRDCIQRGNL